MAEETVTKPTVETDGDPKTWKRRGLLAAAWAAIAGIVLKETTAPVEASTAALLANTETAGVTQFVAGPSSIKVSIGTYTSAQSVLIASAYGASGANAALHGAQVPPGTAAPERCGVYGEGWIYGTGVLGTAASTNVAVHGIATDSAIGVWGDSASNIGVLGTIPAASNANAIGIYGLNNSSYAGPSPGAGGFGVYGLCAKGHGLVGATATAGGAAVVGATNGVAGAYAGAFYGPVVVGGAFTVFGAKSAAVPHPDGSHRLLYCMESPESWFEDFGKGGGHGRLSRLCHAVRRTH